MIAFLSLNSIESESESIRLQVKDLAAKLTEDRWEIHLLKELEELLDFLDESPLVDFACFDVLKRGVIENLSAIRDRYQESLLMLIADTKVSPVEYLKPGIRPDSLILRPITPDNLHETLKSLIDLYLQKRGSMDGKSFVYETRDERISIPYSGIYYFESKEKKIFARTKNDEYGFYDSFEALSGKLPDNFVRCHRSFVINRDMIEDVWLTQGEIELKDGFTIPLSRSYRKDFKDIKKQVKVE